MKKKFIVLMVSMFAIFWTANAAPPTEKAVKPTKEVAKNSYVMISSSNWYPAVTDIGINQEVVITDNSSRVSRSMYAPDNLLTGMPPTETAVIAYTNYKKDEGQFTGSPSTGALQKNTLLKSSVEANTAYTIDTSPGNQTKTNPVMKVTATDPADTDTSPGKGMNQETKKAGDKINDMATDIGQK